MNADVPLVELTAPDIEPYRKGNTEMEFVTTFDSGKPGPHVMVCAVTHGNEICGAITLDFLMQNDIRPTRGKLTFSFNNHMAYQRFDPKAPDETRFIDEDFNRLWTEERLDGDDDTIELRRAREIRPIFHDVDLMLDIHSMGANSAAVMLCHGHEKEVTFSKAVNYPSYIVYGSGHVVGQRLIEYTPFSNPSDNKVALLVEGGRHWDATTGAASTDTALRFLRHADVIDHDFVEAHLSDIGKAPPPAQVWEVTNGIIAKTDDFKFESLEFGPEVVAEAGTVIAHDGDEVITTPYDDCLLLMPNDKAPAGMRKLRLCKRAG
jgi:predicted deacylase